MFGEAVDPVVCAALIVLLVVFVLDKFMKRRKGSLPPGPIGLPVVGYLPFLTNHSHLKFTELAEKYGDVFSLYLGSRLVVVLNDGNSVREAFAKREFLGRPPNAAFSSFGIDTPFFTANYRLWQEQSGFSLQMMRDLGMGKPKMEKHIQDEIKHVLKVIEDTEGKPMNLTQHLTPSVSNIICTLVLGRRYEYNNPTRLMMDYTLNSISNLTAQTSFHIFFPKIMEIPYLLKFFKYDETVKAVKRFYSYIEEKIAEHRKTMDPQNTRDYIDAYMLEMKSRIAKDPKTTFSDKTLIGTVASFFGAGSETVRTTVAWCMYILATFPEIQNRVQKEVTDVLGPSRFPQIYEQGNMPYTQAVIREVLRWKTVSPLGIVRYTVDDTNVSGFFIPKGTVVFANLWAVHHHPRHWDSPQEFKPERFLAEDGTLLKLDNFIPFSVGKRSCPGESMAMMEIFLYLVAILQKFQVSFPEGFEPTFEAELGITYSLKPFEICFTPKVNHPLSK